VDPRREFAVQVVDRLRAAGYEALWAGGCVRDQLLDRVPKDYDVATSAPPAAIREVFGHKRTLPVGAAFGVIAVLGNRGQGQIEVATFRQDAAYSDGRHPDGVVFSTAEHDAQRRDFTINGLFYDPLADEVIDYVGGQADLQAGVVRAIGDPDARLQEDKLRMLRAVRFAAAFNFALDESTLHAVQRHAAEIHVVSAERIADEMRRMLVHPARARAMELLYESRLLAEILPEVHQQLATWPTTLALLAVLGEATFPVALASLLRAAAAVRAPGTLVDEVATRWRLSIDETKRTAWLLTHEATIRTAPQIPWPKLQRLLIADHIEELLQFSAAVAGIVDGQITAIEFCRDKLALPPERLNPSSLITGDDLKAAGIPPGKVYQRLLEATRDAQLLDEIDSHATALEFAYRLWKSATETTSS
jgi:tRNA nucleotidyltransferase/poly(A) polymerase